MGDASEVNELLSQLLRGIHRLPAQDLLAVMEIDEHVRRDAALPGDLDKLREIAARRPA